MNLKLLLILAVALLILMLSSCGFARREVIHSDGTYESVTVWTVFKEIHWGQYNSENDAVDLWTPWGMVKSGEKNEENK